jgi:hypothetical protein
VTICNLNHDKQILSLKRKKSVTIIPKYYEIGLVANNTNCNEPSKPKECAALKPL